MAIDKEIPSSRTNDVAAPPEEGIEELTLVGRKEENMKSELNLGQPYLSTSRHFGCRARFPTPTSDPPLMSNKTANENVLKFCCQLFLPLPHVARLRHITLSRAAPLQMAQ